MPTSKRLSWRQAWSNLSLQTAPHLVHEASDRAASARAPLAPRELEFTASASVVDTVTDTSL